MSERFIDGRTDGRKEGCAADGRVHRGNLAIGPSEGAKSDSPLFGPPARRPAALEFVIRPARLPARLSAVGEGGRVDGGREIGYGDKKQIENTMIGLGERADDVDEAGGQADRQLEG